MRRTPVLVVATLLVGCSDAGVTKFNARPEVTITSHADGDTVRDGYAETLRGAISDPNHSADQLTVAWAVDGVPVCTDSVLGADGVITCEHVFEEGAGEISLEARDPEGSAAVARVTLVVEETDAPTAEITSPDPTGTWYSDQLIAFQGIVGDAEDDPDDLTVTWETDAIGDLGLSIEVTSEGAVEAYGNLPEGEHAVRLRAVDTSGKESLDSVLIVVGPPNSDPTCGIVTPDDCMAGQQGTEVFFGAEVDDVDVSPDRLTVVWSSDTDGQLRTSVPDSDGTVRFSTSDLSVATHLVTLTVTDEVGGTCTDSIYYTVGTPPNLTLLTPSDGDVVDEGDDVRFSATVSDSEDQPTDLLIDWVSDLDGTISSAGADSTGAVSFRTSALTAGDHAITVTVTDTDGLFTVRTIDLTVNAPPVVSGLVITPDPAYNDDMLTCAAAVSDSDGSTPTTAYTWTNTTAGGALGAGNTVTLTSTTASPGDVLTCEVVATDAMGSTTTGSTSLTVSNRDPDLSVALTPTTASAADTLTCTATASDDDADALTTTFAWTVNGTAVTATSTSGLTSTLAGGLAYADVIVCTVTTDDGHGGIVSDSDTVTITNSPPTVSSVTLTPSALQTNDTVAVNASVSDPEGDTVTTTYNWIVSGVTVVSGSTDNTLDGATWFDKGDTVLAEVVADDGVNTTTVASSTITVDNTPPGAPVLAITPSGATAGDALTCEVDTASSDDDADTVTYTMSWTVDGVAYTAGGTSSTGSTFVGPSTTTWPDDTVDGSDVELGQEWVCTATPNDGDDDGSDGTVSLSVFEEVEFDHCGQSGTTGPSQSQCDSSYSGTTLDGEVTVTSGIQYWTVPATGSYVITAAGAAGGMNTGGSFIGGYGAEMSGTFSLTAGDTLAIVVGQRGTDSGSSSSSEDAGGGGGSFVYNDTTGVLLMAAGGGGSGGENDNNTTNMTTYKNGTTSTCGKDAPAHDGGLVSGGCSGSGGGIDGPTYGQGGGGGYLTNGSGAGGGYSFLNGANGNGKGGFGGGGNGGGDGGGGGGGYSGGASGSGGGNPDGPGGGGGSYNGGTSQTNTSGVNTGHGYVVIEGS